MAATTLVTDEVGALIGRSSATFSPCRTYRYALTRRWIDGTEAVTFLMLNPSTADAFQVDPTIRRCIGFAKAWGFGALRVLNLFALRSTDPAALRTHPDPVGPDNDVIIADWVNPEGGPVVAAWGTHGTHLARDRQVVDLLRQHTARVFCLGTTKDGHPRHPLYVRGDAELVPFARTVIEVRA